MYERRAADSPNSLQPQQMLMPHPCVLQLKAVADFAPHARPVAGIAFDLDDGNSLLSCSYDGSVRCLDVVKQVRKAAVW